MHKKNQCLHTTAVKWKEQTHSSLTVIFPLPLPSSSLYEPDRNEWDEGLKCGIKKGKSEMMILQEE